jgi:hypothetical protein
LAYEFPYVSDLSHKLWNRFLGRYYSLWGFCAHWELQGGMVKGCRVTADSLVSQSFHERHEVCTGIIIPAEVFP